MANGNVLKELGAKFKKQLIFDQPEKEDIWNACDDIELAKHAIEMGDIEMPESPAPRPNIEGNPQAPRPYNENEGFDIEAMWENVPSSLDKDKAVLSALMEPETWSQIAQHQLGFVENGLREPVNDILGLMGMEIPQSPVGALHQRNIEGMARNLTSPEQWQERPTGNIIEALSAIAPVLRGGGALKSATRAPTDYASRFAPSTPESLLPSSIPAAQQYKFGGLGTAANIADKMNPLGLGLELGKQAYQGVSNAPRALGAIGAGVREGMGASGSIDARVRQGRKVISDTWGKTKPTSIPGSIAKSAGTGIDYLMAGSAAIGTGRSFNKAMDIIQSRRGHDVQRRQITYKHLMDADTIAGTAEAFENGLWAARERIGAKMDREVATLNITHVDGAAGIRIDGINAMRKRLREHDVAGLSADGQLIDVDNLQFDAGFETGIARINDPQVQNSIKKIITLWQSGDPILSGNPNMLGTQMWSGGPMSPLASRTTTLPTRYNRILRAIGAEYYDNAEMRQKRSGAHVMGLHTVLGDVVGDGIEKKKGNAKSYKEVTTDFSQLERAITNFKKAAGLSTTRERATEFSKQINSMSKMMDDGILANYKQDIFDELGVAMGMEPKHYTSAIAAASFGEPLPSSLVGRFSLLSGLGASLIFDDLTFGAVNLAFTIPQLAGKILYGYGFSRSKVTEVINAAKNARNWVSKNMPGIYREGLTLVEVMNRMEEQGISGSEDDSTAKQLLGL